MIEFRDETFRFRPRRPAASRLTATRPRDSVNAFCHRQGFTIIMRLTLTGPVTEPVTLVELRDAVRITLRPAGGVAEPERSIDAAQNYLAFPEPGGAVPVIEVALTLHSKWHPE